MTRKQGYNLICRFLLCAFSGCGAGAGKNAQQEVEKEKKKWSGLQKPSWVFSSIGEFIR